MWPRVLEAEVEWTQQKKSYCEGADKVTNSYITIPSSAPKTDLAAFPQTSFLLSVDSVSALHPNADDISQACPLPYGTAITTAPATVMY